jgi:plasmid maintenance system antidote protein VapI
MIQDVNKRVVEIQDRYQLTSAQFAARLGIQRARLSHLSNARNNVSLDFLLTVLTKFPDVNAEWLMRGKGSMIRDTNEGKFEKTAPKIQEPDRKPEKSEPVEKTLINEDKNPQVNKLDQSINQNNRNQNPEHSEASNVINSQMVNNFFTPQTNGKRIINVVLVFSDNTFRPLNLE